MEDNYKHFVGVDWATVEHEACMLEASGKQIDARSFKHSGDGLADLCARLLKLGDPASIAVAIEVPHGAVVETLLDRGFAVFSINPKQLDRFRDRFTVAGAKDDRRDAMVLADSLRTDGHLFRRVVVPVVAGIVFLLGVATYLWKPKHVGVRFDKKVPPIIARVNTPTDNAPELARTKHFPTGDQYVIPERAKGHFVMVFDWPIHLDFYVKNLDLNVPKLMTTDFASIPKILHSLLSPLNNTIYAAILHDYLYRNPTDAAASAVARPEADRAFYWGMRACGVWKVTAGLMYFGVRLGGGRSYRRG